MSRDISDLTPLAAEKCRDLIRICQEKYSIDVLVTCTFRSNTEQADLYAQGRTKPGPIVTYAKAGESNHQKRIAFDVVPLVNGKPVWDDALLWELIGHEGEKLGLSWAGRWTKFKEMPHFELKV